MNGTLCRVKSLHRIDFFYHSSLNCYSIFNVVILICNAAADAFISIFSSIKREFTYTFSQGRIEAF